MFFFIIVIVSVYFNNKSPWLLLSWLETSCSMDSASV